MNRFIRHIHTYIIYVKYNIHYLCYSRTCHARHKKRACLILVYIHHTYAHDWCDYILYTFDITDGFVQDIHSLHIVMSINNPSYPILLMKQSQPRILQTTCHTNVQQCRFWPCVPYVFFSDAVLRANLLRRGKHVVVPQIFPLFASLNPHTVDNNMVVYGALPKGIFTCSPLRSCSDFKV